MKKTVSHYSRLITCKVFVILIIFSANLVDPAEDFPGERDGLILLRDSINTSLFDFHANWTGPPCHKNLSRWAGISCLNYHVVQISLDGLNLTGSLFPSFLENITFLNKLSLKNNSISALLPNLTNLFHLQVVSLSHNDFFGAIPLEYINLPRLEKLELQENYLQGSIPPFNQTTLKDFNVSHNQLQGQIPETPTLQGFSKDSYDYNAALCGRPVNVPCPGSSPPPKSTNVPPAPSPPPESTNVPPAPSPVPVLGTKKKQFIDHPWIIVSISVAAVVVIVSMLAIVLLCCRGKIGKSGGTDKRSHWSSESTDGAERNGGLVFLSGSRGMFDLDELLRSSAEIIGRGKFGITYKAVMESGPVAVKRLKLFDASGKYEFSHQFSVLGKMKHENLAEIISYFHSDEEKLIIYEYVPDGSLFDLLHGNIGHGKFPLKWTTRLSIIKDIARGLEFLHQSMKSDKPPHGNLKSSNVLVDHFWEGNHFHAKLTDYGLLPLLSSLECIERLAIGKVPEFSLGKKLTMKADVYCFGIVLLEIITGRIPGEKVTRVGGKIEDDLPGWVKKVVNVDWSTDVLDVELLAEKEGYDEMLKLIEIGLECTEEEPQERPEISDILRRVEEIEFKHRGIFEGNT